MRGEGTFVTYFRSFQQLFNESRKIYMQISCTLSTCYCCFYRVWQQDGKIFANISRPTLAYMDDMHEGKMNATWFPTWSSSTVDMNDVVEWKIRFEWERIFLNRTFLRLTSYDSHCLSSYMHIHKWSALLATQREMCWKNDDRLISRLTKNVN